MDLTSKYPHLIFSKNWTITDNAWYLLGQCESLVKSISNTPILPKYKQDLLQVSLIKGAQATTAIEGNTLTEDEIRRVEAGDKLPPSKEYQEVEVKNILNAFNKLLTRVVYQSQSEVIRQDFIKELHRMVGQELGEYFDAIPGKYREDMRVVGTYRCPDPRDVDQLMEKYCAWLLREFRYDKGIQQYPTILIQAITAHVYFEWIHPFGDGNGRTGRLIEFYILLRGKTPSIASHILSNHYNLTRSEYYRQLNLARQNRDLSGFMEYALLGFKDGLDQTLKTIQNNQMEITWHKLIYDKFAHVKIGKRNVFKRRRQLILDYPLNSTLSLEQITEINPKIAKAYAVVSNKTAERDILALIELELLVKDGKKYKANIELLGSYLASKKQ